MDTQNLGPETAFVPGAPRVFQVGTQPVCVLKTEKGWVAFEDFCPHRAGPLSEGECDGETVTCPWHRARFDLRTGAPVAGPCNRRLRLREIRVRDGFVHVLA